MIQTRPSVLPFAFSFCLLLAISISCSPSDKPDAGNRSQLSSFTIQELTVGAGLPEWASVDIEMIRTDATQGEFKRSILRTAFSSGRVEDLSIKIPQGTYNINLIYRNSSNAVVYQACQDIRNKEYAINTPTFETSIRICQESSGSDVGTVPIVPSSEVVITPTIDDGGSTPTPNGGNQEGNPAPEPNAQLCIQANYGLPRTAARASRTQYDAYTGELRLPALAVTASNADLKTFVRTVYASFPVFKEIYENELGLSQSQALAFMFAVMSRESASGERWRIDLETGVGGPGHAWGPFQAAVTNFTGFNYDSEILRFTGLPVPDRSKFFDPAVSTYVGMKRLAEGILKSIQDFGAGQEAKLYLLGTLAHHNTGHTQAARNQDWLNSYGHEVLRLMQGYLFGSNLSNERAFWTTQPAAEICR